MLWKNTSIDNNWSDRQIWLEFSRKGSLPHIGRLLNLPRPLHSVDEFLFLREFFVFIEKYFRFSKLRYEQTKLRKLSNNQTYSWKKIIRNSLLASIEVVKKIMKFYAGVKNIITRVFSLRRPFWSKLLVDNFMKMFFSLVQCILKHKFSNFYNSIKFLFSESSFIGNEIIWQP